MKRDSALELRKAREEWFATERGAFAAKALQTLLSALTSGWPRRNSSMLILQAGSGPFMENLWEAGFNVDGQEDSAEFYHTAKEKMKQRGGCTIAPPDQLPFHDLSYEYTVAVCALELCTNPQDVLEEIQRVTRVGTVIIFSSRFSLARITGKGKQPKGFLYPVNPLRVKKMTSRIFGRQKRTWASTFAGPPGTWRNSRFFGPLNSLVFPFPLGAFCGLRVDFDPPRGMTPLLLPTRPTAVNDSGLVRPW